MISGTTTPLDAGTLAINLRRLMARDDLTFDDVVDASGLDERTVRAVARGNTNPHARTLHKLASGLGVSIDELFRPVDRLAPRRFDRASNLLVEKVVAANDRTFAGWSAGEFDELYSRFATGGALTETGVLVEAEAMNAKRHVWRQIGVIFESGEAELLTEFVEVLYRRAVVSNQPLRTPLPCRAIQ